MPTAYKLLVDWPDVANGTILTQQADGNYYAPSPSTMWLSSDYIAQYVTGNAAGNAVMFEAQ